MVIVPDVLDMFMPILDGFFVPRGQAMASIESLMAQIPLMFADTKETEGTIAAGIQGGMEALKVILAGSSTALLKKKKQSLFYNDLCKSH